MADHACSSRIYRTTTGRFNRLFFKDDRIVQMNNCKFTSILSKGSPRAPPIYVNTEMISSTQLITLACLSFTVKEMGPDLLIINMCSFAHYCEAIAVLKERGIQFHTHFLDKEKNEKFVIKGLPKGLFDVEQIADEIRKMGFDPSHITELPLAGEYMTFYLVYFKPEQREQACKFEAVKKIACVIVKVERFRERRGPHQCYKCQRWGHSSARCNNRQRCVACAGEHDIKSCTLDKSQKPSCANCYREHPANYRGCRVFKASLEKMQRCRNKNKNSVDVRDVASAADQSLGTAKAPASSSRRVATVTKRASAAQGLIRAERVPPARTPFVTLDHRNAASKNTVSYSAAPGRRAKALDEQLAVTSAPSKCFRKGQNRNGKDSAATTSSILPNRKKSKRRSKKKTKGRRHRR